MGTYELLLILFVFGAVGALAYPVAGVLGNASARRLRTRLDALTDTVEAEQSVSAIRARYLRQLSPLERQLEQLPGMERLGLLCEQAGWTAPAYRIATLMLVLGGGAAMLALLFTLNPLIILGAGALAAAAPVWKARGDRASRVEKFEGQLPDALDLMSRSLRAGNPLMESFKFVSEEMKPPISTDFGRAWSNVNYGVSLKSSLADFLERTPSVSLRSLATAILVQRETGGNLAEILDKITHVLRARAKFQRRLRTLTAEGRMSGWILGGLPFGLAAILSSVNPDYLPILINDPSGRRIIYGSLVLMAVGLFWITRIVKIRV
jgi:tight adherence protein B